jgi:hypothetical protein
VAEKKTKVTPPPTVAGGEPTGAWARVLADTRAKGKAIEPFEITEGLVLSPPTPTRARAMARATLSVQAAIAASVNAIKFGADQAGVDAIQSQLEAGDAAYTRALLGDDNYDAVQEFFANKGQWELEAFYTAIKVQFLKEPTEEELTRIEQLEDQVTQLVAAVKRLDPDNPVLAEIAGERPGKGPESSTTSTTTGQTSNPTSPDTSGFEPATGATTDPGTSSSTTPKLALA